MKNLLGWISVLLVYLFLSACGGSGGGGDAAAGGGGGGGGGTTPPAPATLTGTVTDTTLAPVSGATVTAGGSSTTTDAAGRYTITGLTAATTHTLSISHSNALYASGGGKVVLASGQTTCLDLFLPRAKGQAFTQAADFDLDSDNFIGSPLGVSHLLLPMNSSLQNSTGAAYLGSAIVHQTPIDVSEPGHGLANYQISLGVVTAALSSTSTLVEPLASASVYVDDDVGNPLSFVTNMVDLTLPIPVSLQDNTDPIDLWYLDEASGTWVQNGTASLDLGGSSYTGNISRPGVWIAGVERSSLDTITGSLKFSDGSAAAGATIYLIGSDNALHGITITNGSGDFSIAGKSLGSYTLHTVVWANGAQWPHSQAIDLSVDNNALGNVALPYAPPTAGASASATITIDRNANVAPQYIGYILGSGRQISSDEDIPAIDQVADVSFIANGIDAGNGLINLEATNSGSGIQEMPPTSTFENLTVEPGGVYDPILTVANLESRIDLPVLVVVKIPTAIPGTFHYAKISIDNVTRVNPIGTFYTVTFRHAFSLTGTF